jgi:hypothetical protein
VTATAALESAQVPDMAGIKAEAAIKRATTKCNDAPIVCVRGNASLSSLYTIKAERRERRWRRSRLHSCGRGWRYTQRLETALRT